MDTAQSQVTLLVDPVCPWSWRAAQWILEARAVRSIRVSWGLLSLEFLNRHQPSHPMMERFKSNRMAMRLLWWASLRGGNRALESVYLGVARAFHEQGKPLELEDTLRGALVEAGLPPEWVEEAAGNEELDRDLWCEYQELASTGAFGVPTLLFGDSKVPYYGPVITSVPAAERAGDLWDHVAGLARHEYFCELKRPR